MSDKVKIEIGDCFELNEKYAEFSKQRIGI